MSLNYKEIDKILSEIDLTGAHLQKIKQPNFHSLYLEFYKPGGRIFLFICLAPGKTRIHTTSSSQSTEIKLQRFSQFMRSRVKGAKVLNIKQEGSNRIVKIEMLRAGEPLTLWVRLWSGAANIIACDAENNILDAFYRRPAKGEVSGGAFSLPEERASNKVFTIRELPGSGSFNEKIADLYFSVEYNEELSVLKNKVLKKLKIDETRAESTLKNLEKKTGKYKEYDLYKQTGDLIMSNIHLIKKGATWVVVNNYYADNAETKIELNPTLSPEKNAEKYYNSYRKAKSGIEKVQEDLLNQKLVLKNIRSDIEKYNEETNIETLKNFISSIPKQTKTEIKEKPPGLNYRSGPFSLLVGRSSKENDILLRKYVRGNDIWLHTRDYPGGYVFIKTIKGKSVPLENLLDAGNLALFYSKGKSSGRGELYYTQVKYLRRAKDGPQGLVLPTHEKNLSIILDEKRLSRMMEG
ncbi:MAG: NFACT family protein [Spirochaetales bacterium]|nr:NFACT family protein [Spirochaetales bacterium]